MDGGANSGPSLLLLLHSLGGRDRRPAASCVGTPLLDDDNNGDLLCRRGDGRSRKDDMVNDESLLGDDDFDARDGVGASTYSDDVGCDRRQQ